MTATILSEGCGQRRRRCKRRRLCRSRASTTTGASTDRASRRQGRQRARRASALNAEDPGDRPSGTRMPAKCLLRFTASGMGVRGADGSWELFRRTSAGSSVEAAERPGGCACSGGSCWSLQWCWALLPGGRADISATAWIPRPSSGPARSTRAVAASTAAVGEGPDRRPGCDAQYGPGRHLPRRPRCRAPYDAARLLRPDATDRVPLRLVGVTGGVGPGSCPAAGLRSLRRGTPSSGSSRCSRRAPGCPGRTPRCSRR
jgi:hypothetical protein